MDIYNYVYDRVFAAIEGMDYDTEALRAGMDAYANDNCFEALTGKFSDSVIQSVIDSGIKPLLAGPKRDLILFFSNYKLIEEIRLLNNRSLRLATEKMAEGSCDPSAVRDMEKSFEEIVWRVYLVEGLGDYLTLQMSEIISNLDYAKGTSDSVGYRLGDLERYRRK